MTHRVTEGAVAAMAEPARAHMRQHAPIAPGLVDLFQAIQALRRSDGAFALQLLACHARAGTSLVATHFARAAALAGAGEVLLIDVTQGGGALHADPLLPLLHATDALLHPAMFRLDPACGALYNARLAGRISPGQPLPPTAIARCIAALRERFTMIVLDCMPLDLLPQMAMLSRFCDGSALVVRAEATERAAVLRARQAIEAMGGRLLGSVFNGARF